MVRSTFIHVLLLAVLPIFVKETECAETTAVITPGGYNASLDPEANFTFQCDVTGAEGVQWFVDGLHSARQDVRNRGISESAVIPIDDTTGSYKANITLAKNILNSNTTIICKAFIILSADVPSEPALFKIQGLLDAPSNLMLSEVDNQHMRRLSWDEPFFLDITDIEPDISHYNICYSLVNVTAQKSRCNQVTQAEYVFLYVNIPLLFTVSAVNVVGEGNSSFMLHEATSCNGAKGVIKSRAS